MAKAPNMLINPITHSDRARTIIDTDNQARTLAVTPEGYLQVGTVEGTSGVHSVGNTTIAPLAAGETFTGEWELIEDYAIIKVFIFADQAGAIGGLLFQQSPDQVIIDNEVYEYANSSSKLFTPNPVSKWFRIIYTNGSIGQAVFNLSVIYSYVYTKPTSHRLGDDVSGNDDVELTKTVVAFRDETDDTYHNIGVQHAQPVDLDSIYGHNVWVNESVVTDWIDLDGAGGDVIALPFTNLHTRIQNTTSTDPKILTVHFNRTVSAQQIGMGCTGGGTFSNVKLVLLGSGGVTRDLLNDSLNDTKYTSKNYQFTPELFNAIRIEYHTTDTVTVSNITIQKSTLVAAQLKGQQPDGTLQTIGSTPSGNLKTSDAENGLAIAKGEVVGSTFIHKFGAAPDFDIADGFVTVWDGAEDGEPYESMNYVYSTTADITQIVAENNGDTQDVEIQGLDVDYALVVQTITLTGNTPAALTTPLIRVFRLKNVGSVDFAGHVFCVITGATITAGVPQNGTQVRAVVHGANNQTEMAVFTIPAGYTGYMRDWYASTAGAKQLSSHTIKLLARPFGQVFQLKHTSNIDVTGTSYIQHVYVEPEKFSEKTDIEMRMNTDSNEAGVASGFDIVLVAN